MRWFGAILMAGMLLPGSVQAEKTLANMIRAIVNDSIITQNEVLMNARSGLQSVYRIYYDRPILRRQEERKVLEDSLESLVEHELILSDYKTSGLQLPEAVIEDEIKRRIRERFGDRASLTKELQARGITSEDYRKRLREDFIILAMRQHNVHTALIVSPAKIEQYYQQNLTNYTVGDQVRIRMLVMSVPTPDVSPEVRKLMREILRKINAGSPFADMASIYSEGSQRQQAGDWGWCDRNYLTTGLSDIAFAMEKGQLSPLLGIQRKSEFAYSVYIYDTDGALQRVRTYDQNPSTGKAELVQEQSVTPKEAAGLLEPDEYYLMRVEDKRAAHTRPLAEVQSEIEKDLLEKESQRLRKKWIDRLRAKAFVRYF